MIRSYQNEMVNDLAARFDCDRSTVLRALIDTVRVDDHVDLDILAELIRLDKEGKTP